MLNRTTSNGAYAIGLAASLASAVLLLVVVLAQAVERTQAFV